MEAFVLLVFLIIIFCVPISLLVLFLVAPGPPRTQGAPPSRPIGYGPQSYSGGASRPTMSAEDIEQIKRDAAERLEFWKNYRDY